LNRVFVLLVLGAAVLGCSDEPDPADYIRAVVDTDLVAPTELDSFSVVVEKASSTKFEEDYDLAVVQSLPSSLILEEPSPTSVSPSNEWQLPMIRITVTGYRETQPIVWSSASFRYGWGRRQVALPLCHDCLDQPCQPGWTCHRGTCEDDTTEPVSEDDTPVVDPLRQCSPR
jgi:hypothetical protein